MLAILISLIIGASFGYIICGLMNMAAKTDSESKGYWIDDHGSDKCSECGFSCNDPYYLGAANFCPECGSDMRRQVK